MEAVTPISGPFHGLNTDMNVTISSPSTIMGALEPLKRSTAQIQDIDMEELPRKKQRVEEAVVVEEPMDVHVVAQQDGDSTEGEEDEIILDENGLRRDEDCVDDLMEDDPEDETKKTCVVCRCVVHCMILLFC